MRTTPYSGLMRDAVSRLSSIESQVLEAIKLNLLQKVSGVWTQSDDDLFSPHTTYCVECWQSGLPETASRFWEETLNSEVKAADTVLAKQTPPTRIHKGAAFYDTGLGYLLAGHLDKAVAWISEAGQEEANRGTGNGHSLLLGNHGLTEKWILTPLVTWMTSSPWQSEWLSVTSRNLDLSELKGLVNWLSTNVENAIHLIVSLLRLKAIESLPMNDAVRHVRVQGYADLLLIVESSLRAWQTSPQAQGQQLYNRLDIMLSAKAEAKKAFKAAEGRFASQFPKDPATNKDHPDKETSTAVNWVINDTLTHMCAAAGTAERAGIACHLVARLRNSLMHVIDGSVDLYQDDTKFLRVAAITLAVIRLSQSADEGTLAALPIT